MTALTCTRCGDASLTVEAAAEFVRAHGRLPACACEHGTRAAMLRSGACWCAACLAAREHRTRAPAAVS